MKKEDSKKSKKEKKQMKKEKEEREAAQILMNCRNSMGQIFSEQELVTRALEEDAFFTGFAASPEYRQALQAYRARLADESPDP